jgi:DNA replication and repair protein RecF
MYLKHLSLTNFRNYTRLELDLPARLYVLQGENAQGKTNLLEAIYYLATTRSPLSGADRQLMHWEAEREVIPHAYVEGTYHRAGEDHRIQMALVKERAPGAAEEEASVFRRQIRLDGVVRQAWDVVGKLNVVLFLPEDIALVAGSPGERRHYLDVTLCQLDAVYCRTLARYNRVVTQRNALLHRIRAGEAAAGELAYWDEQLASLGAFVLERRLWAVRELEAHLATLQPALTGGQEQLTLVYQDSVAVRSEDAAEGGAVARERAFLSALRQARREELARAVTVLGPHRDDLRFLINGVDAQVYGSRGQQRTVAVALKLAEVALMESQCGETPVLLLDDVISELDQRRTGFLLQTIARAQQVLITTTDLHFYGRGFLAEASLWRVAAGVVTPLGLTERF